MSDVKIGYKVVRECEGNIYISATELALTVRYDINKITTQPTDCGPLAIFDTIEHAKDFQQEFIFRENYKIFEAEYIESEYRNLWVYKQPCACDILNGTCFAKSIKLLRNIDDVHTLKHQYYYCYCI